MRPSLRLDGQPAPLLDSDLIEATVIARADGVRCAVALANWGDVGGTSGFLHFDGALEPGRALAVTLAERLVFAGVINAIEARYPGDAPSTLLLEAAGMLAACPTARRRGWRWGPTCAHAASDGRKPDSAAINPPRPRAPPTSMRESAPARRSH